MAFTESIASSFPSSCEIKVPDPAADPHSILSRWSDSNVSIPSLVVTPSTETDIVAAIKFAKQHSLRIIPANGGHGAFVPIDEKTLYLDLTKLRSVAVDKQSSTVTIAGGATAGDVLKTCTKEGYYTLIPNSNAVGMIGAFLGGGSNVWNGLHGFAVDHTVSIRIVTSTGDACTVSSKSSSADERALFHALCGAGHGLGVVTELTLRAWPVANLRLDEGKFWARRIVFPANEIGYAAELYLKLLPPPRRMSGVLAFAQLPTPQGLQPVIMLAVAYYGPVMEAEETVRPLLTEEVAQHATKVDTMTVPLEKVNDANEPFNQHGGTKDLYTCLLENTTVETVKSAFEKWLHWTTEIPEAKRSYVVFGSWDTTVNEANDPEKTSYFRWRSRKLLVQCVPWYQAGMTEEILEKIKKWGSEMMEAVHVGDQGAPKANFANNLVKGSDMRQVYSDEQIEKIQRVKKVWDAYGLFWNPVVDGW